MRNLFPNAWHVARREYLIRVRSRTFVVLTVLLAIIALGLTIAPVALRALGNDRPLQVAVLVEADDLASDPLPLLSAALNGAAGAAGATRAELSQVADPAATESRVRNGDLDGLLTIERSDDGGLAFTYLTDAASTSPSTLAIRQAASALTIDDRLGSAGIDPADRGAIFAPPAFEARAVDPDAAAREEGGDYATRASLGTVLVVLIFMAILTYGNWIAASVAEEKSNRVMELLITAASPQQLLVGKVLGAGAAGLTQYAVMLVVGFIGLQLQGQIGRIVFGDAAAAAPGGGLTLPLLLVFGACFVGGFLVYAALYAAAGSLVSRVEEVQQMSGPIIVIAMLGYFAAIFGGTTSPNATWLSVMSFVPFFAPYLIPLRMAYDTITPLEIVAALAALALGAVLALWLASRIYAAGVLLYGQRPSLRALWRAARVAR
ncbi:MAG: ABC transporter permease [Chloroflexota bacterium]